MTAFSITCTTCQTRLSVRDPEAEGRILPCPKCGSMVLVSRDPLASRPAPEPESGADEPSDQADTVVSAVETEDLPQGDLPDQELDWRDEKSIAPASPAGQWTSNETQAFRRWLLLGVSGVAVVLVVIAIVGAWLGPDSAQADASDATSQAETAEDADPPDVTTEPPAIEPATEPATETPGPDDSPPAPAVAPSDDGAPAADSQTPPPNPPPPVDPPAASDGGAANDAPPGLVAQPAPENAGLGAALDDLERMFQAAPEPELLDQDRRDFEFEYYPPGHWLFAGMERRDPPPLNNHPGIARRFQLPTAGLETPEMSLHALARMAGELSGAPVGLDTDALAAAGHSPATRLPAATGQGNLGQAISNVLEPLGLTLQPREFCVEITTTDAAVSRTRRWPVGDLLQTPPDAARLAGWIRNLALASPEAGVALQAEVLTANDLTPPQARRVETFLSVLRAARGLPAEPPPLAYTRDRDVLQRKITINRPLRAPLESILDEIGAAVDREIVIDWGELSALGWRRDTQVKLVCQDETPIRALAVLLTPLGMDFEIVDQRAWKVTSVSAAARSATCRAHSIADVIGLGADPVVLNAALRHRLGEPHFGDESDDGWRIEYDPSSHHFLARLPQRDQVRMASMLVALRRRIRGR